MPASANVSQSSAKVSGDEPCGLSAVHVKARPCTPVMSRTPAIPKRGPRNAATIVSGSSASSSTTSSCSEQLPKSMFRSCAGLSPTVSTANSSIAHGRERHLDALLQRQRLRARADVGGRRAQEVCCRNPLHGRGGFACRGVEPLMPEEPEKQRQAFRLDVNEEIVVALEEAGRTMSATLVDLSEGGCRLRTRLCIPQ